MAQLIDASGVVVFEGTIVGGGSQPKIVRFPFAFDTSGIVLTGVDIYTPAATEVLLTLSISVTTAWNGTTPALHLYSEGETPDSGDLGTGLDEANSARGSHMEGIATTQGGRLFLDATPLVAMIDDGAGGDPGATQGEGELVLLIAAAS